MSEALRFNNDKPMMSYFMRSFPRMAEAVARVKEMGAIKYNDGNWRLGNKPDDEYWNSMFRHLNYIFGGEFYDSDTGCLHIAHAVWNLCALLELNYPDLPARDEAIWANRAKHWAEEKQKREAPEKVETVEQMGADMAARWAAEGERKREEADAADAEAKAAFAEAEADFAEAEAAFAEDFRRDFADATLYAAFAADSLWHRGGVDPCPVDPPQGSLERFAGTLENMATMAAEMADLFGAECPMCGDLNLGSRRQGLECEECGEIYAVPLGPENGIGEVVDAPGPLWVAEPPFPPGFSFVIKREDLAPTFAKLVDEYFGKPWRI